MTRPTFEPGDHYNLAQYGVMYVMQEQIKGADWFSFAQVNPQTAPTVVKHRVLCDETSLDGNVVSTTGEIVTRQYNDRPRLDSVRRFLDRLVEIGEAQGAYDRPLTRGELLVAVADVRIDL